MRTTLLGSLLDVAARQPRPRRRARRALRVRPRLPAGRRRPSGERRRWRASSPGSGRRRSPSRTGSAALAVGAARRRRPGGAAASRPTSSRSRACSRRSPAQLGVELDFEPAEEPFLHPGRAAAVIVGGAAAGWLGEVHPLVCRAWDLDAGRRLRSSTWRRCSPPRPPARRVYEDVTTFPAVYQDLAVVVAGRDAGRARCAPRCWPAAASCCARPRSSTSTRASSSARAARASRCGSSSAPPTAPSPTRRSPGCATRSQGEAGRDRGDAP